MHCPFENMCLLKDWMVVLLVPQPTKVQFNFNLLLTISTHAFPSHGLNEMTWPNIKTSPSHIIQTEVFLWPHREKLWLKKRNMWGFPTLSRTGIILKHKKKIKKFENWIFFTIWFFLTLEQGIILKHKKKDLKNSENWIFSPSDSFWL